MACRLHDIFQGEINIQFRPGTVSDIDFNQQKTFSKEGGVHVL